MCGIAGLWSSQVGIEPTQVVARMRRALHHRGPDSQGLWSSSANGIALGHSRLAIVDLSAEGHQPMHSGSGRYVIVYNGEIYNHAQLRRELGSALPWRGHSDTETLLEGFEQWGVGKTVQRAVGMFSFAVWDARDATLTLARDRLGEKPLYYGFGTQGLAFASELKALRHCPGLDYSLDAAALAGYLRLGYIGAPLSIYRGIRKLRPGTLLVLRHPRAGAAPSAYWSLPCPLTEAQQDAPPTEGDDASRIERLEALMSESVRQQMLSDVPLGAFLSGGIDSSLVVALMQRASAKPVRTFCMGFANEQDESRHAREIAARLGTEHTELTVSPADVLNLVPRLSSVFDEPFADASQVPTLLLSELTRRHVTVALSGDGGDELFGGYNRHLAAVRLDRLRAWLPAPLLAGLARTLHTVPAAWWDAAASAAQRRTGRLMPLAMGEKMHRLAGMLAARDKRDAYLATVSQWLEPGSPSTVASGEPELPQAGDASLAQSMMWWDLQTYLPDDILVKVDRAAMACSLETRVPFLDHRVVEFALATPLHCKIRHGRSKWLLRELLARHLPRTLFERPKQGFTVPLDEWLRGPLREWAENLLCHPTLEDTGLLSADRVTHVWREHLSGRRNHQRALWTVLMLQSWLQEQRQPRPEPVAHGV